MTLKQLRIIRTRYGEEEKAKAAAIFYAKWKAAEHDLAYAAMKTDWEKTRG